MKIEDRKCPKCKGVMRFTLGHTNPPMPDVNRYTCIECGYEEAISGGPWNPSWRRKNKELIIAFDGEPRAKTPFGDRDCSLIAIRGDYQLELSLKDGSVTADLIHRDLAKCPHCYFPKMKVGDVLLCPNMEDSPMHGYNPGNPACGISFDDMLTKYNLTREDYREARKGFRREMK